MEGAPAALPEGGLVAEHAPQAAVAGTEAEVATPRAAGVAPEPAAGEERGPPPPAAARRERRGVVATAPDGPLALAPDEPLALAAVLSGGTLRAASPVPPIAAQVARWRQAPLVDLAVPSADRPALRSRPVPARDG
ncbi:MAG TPA: hypothetical protein VNW90_13020 [Acetobacteraceae bacterium]|nr:hypothetical protein [Acetobacteraceae bacterium]